MTRCRWIGCKNKCETVFCDTHTPAPLKQASQPRSAPNQASITPGSGPSKHSKGGTARAAKLSPERRSEIARQAARKRWHIDGVGPEPEELDE